MSIEGYIYVKDVNCVKTHLQNVNVDVQLGQLLEHIQQLKQYRRNNKHVSWLNIN